MLSSYTCPGYGRSLVHPGAQTNLATVEQAVRRVGAGQALILRGRPSSGRTTLLDHAATFADERTTILRASGSRAEVPLPYGFLHQLLVPFDDRLPELPVFQADALAMVLRLRAGRPDPAAVGAGLRSLLLRLTVERAVLVLIDDVELVDPESVDALGFAARRLSGHEVALLLTARTGRVPPALTDLPSWDLRPLSTAEATALVTRQTGGSCGPRIVEVLLAATDGLPGELVRVAGLLPTLRPGDDLSADALLVRTATAAWRSGDGASAMRLLAHVSDDGSHQGEVRRLQGLFELRSGMPEVASDMLVEAATALPPATALRVLVEACEAALYAGDVARLTAISGRARDLLEPRDGPDGAVIGDEQRPQLAFAEGVAATLAGRPGEGVPLLATTSRSGAYATRPHEVLQAGIAAITMGDAATARVLLTRSVRRARASGATGLASNALEFLAISEILLGRYVEASNHAEEGLVLARGFGHATTEASLLAALALSAAFRGALDECRSRAEQTLRIAVGQSLGLAGAAAEWALAVGDLARGDVAAAADRLRAVGSGETGTGHPLIGLLSAPHLIEAAVRAGRPAVARVALQRFLPFAIASGQPWAGALALRGRAMLTPDADEADALFARAIVLHTRAGGRSSTPARCACGAFACAPTTSGPPRPPACARARRYSSSSATAPGPSRPTRSSACSERRRSRSVPTTCRR